MQKKKKAKKSREQFVEAVAPASESTADTIFTPDLAAAEAESMQTNVLTENVDKQTQQEIFEQPTSQPSKFDSQFTPTFTPLG